MTGPLKLLAIFPHPDDETLGLGSTLARYSAEGMETYLVCATHGERGWYESEGPDPGLEAVAKIRTEELNRAAEHLGLKEVNFLDYIDGDVDQADPMMIIGKLVTHIRRIKPQVVVTFAPDGAYGHPDHIALSQFTHGALVCAADGSFADGLSPHRVSKLYYMVDSLEVVQAANESFGGLSMEVDGVTRHHQGWQDWQITTVLDNTRYMDKVQKAIQCHRSQLSGYGPIGGWSVAELSKVFGTGYFYRTLSLVNGGRNAETDLFEGFKVGPVEVYAKLGRWLIYVFVLALAACQPTSTPTFYTTSSPTPIPILPTTAPTSPPAETDPPTVIPTIPASIMELEGAEVPPGFSILKFADVYRPTAFAFDAQGRMYVTSVDSKVYQLSDLNLDGRAELQTTFATGYYLPLGIAVHLPTGEVYVSHQSAITVLHDTDGDGKADRDRIFVDNLPTDLHQNDNLKFGPDGWLYMGLGSTCDACSEFDARSASILRFNIESGASEIYASGLRNPYDIAFHPFTGELFSTDNGRDDLGLEFPSEELNHIIRGGDYGFPNCWDAQEQPGCENTIPAVAFFESHSSANGLDFYNGNRFPAEYRGNAFVSIFGLWLKPNVQTGIQRVILTQDSAGYTGSTTWFVRFPEGVMPLPLLFGPDEALYVGDYINSVIYRISYGVP